MSNNLILTNARVITLAKNVSACEAVLVEQGKIVTLGSIDEIQGLAQGKNHQVIDVQKKVVLPGFFDCHAHIMSTGLNASGIDLNACRSVDEILQKVRVAAQEYPEERWIFGRSLDESLIKEKRPPTAAELDSVAPKHAVYILDRGLHYTLVNSRAFDLLGIPKDTVGIRKENDGSISGRMHEKANTLAKRGFFDKIDRSQREDAVLYTTKKAVQAGVTTIHAVEGGELFSDYDIPVLLDMAKSIPVHVTLYWSIEDIERIQQAGLPRMGGDILLDGSIGSRTAAFFEPYSDNPETCGSLLRSQERVIELITNAHLNDIQISFHAIGEKAIEQALDCFGEVFKKYPKKDHRHRIEHFGFPRKEAIQRAGELGVVVSSQPAFTYLRGGPNSVYNQRLGDARERRGYPHRALLDAGIIVGGGSDSDVTPINPLLAMHSAVNPPYAEHAVTVEEALRMMTSEAAKMAFEENQKGTIEPGKIADFVVLDRNPLTSPSDSIKDIQVLMTIKQGEVVFKG